MDLDERRRLLFAAVGGFLLVGLLQVVLPGWTPLSRGALQFAALVLAGAAVYRFLPRG